MEIRQAQGQSYMAMIRISIFTPQEGNDAGVTKLMEALDTALAQEAGYVLGLRFSGMDGAREVGRIYVWESLEAGRRAEASPEASPLLRRIEELSEPGPVQRSYDLLGYALRPNRVLEKPFRPSPCSTSLRQTQDMPGQEGGGTCI